MNNGGDDRPKRSRRQWMDTLAVVLITLGSLGLVATAFLWTPLAGAAACSAYLIAVGVWVGLEEGG